MDDNINLSLKGSHFSKGEIKVIIRILSDKDLKIIFWVPSKKPLVISAKRCMSRQNVNQSLEMKNWRGLLVR